MNRYNILAVLKDLVAAIPDTSSLKSMAKEVADKFFPGLEIPTFKIVHSTASRWLGRTTVKYKQGVTSTVIEIQKSILNDAKTLHRVVAHEMIHYYLDTKNIEKEIENKKTKVSKDPHGDEFKAVAEKMNAVYGENYVTETSNLSFVIEELKEFYIIIEPFKEKSKDKFGVSKTISPSKHQKVEIANRVLNNKAHVFKTKDKTFWNAIDIKKYGGFSVYSDEDMQNKIAEMYNNSKNVDNLFKVE